MQYNLKGTYEILLGIRFIKDSTGAYTPIIHTGSDVLPLGKEEEFFIAIAKMIKSDLEKTNSDFEDLIYDQWDNIQKAMNKLKVSDDS